MTKPAPASRMIKIGGREGIDEDGNEIEVQETGPDDYAWYRADFDPRYGWSLTCRTLFEKEPFATGVMLGYQLQIRAAAHFRATAGRRQALREASSQAIAAQSKDRKDAIAQARSDKVQANISKLNRNNDRRQVESSRRNGKLARQMLATQRQSLSERAEKALSICAAHDTESMSEQAARMGISKDAFSSILRRSILKHPAGLRAVA